MAKKVLLTGGSGFLGKYLIKKLIDRGYNLRCILRNPNKCCQDSGAEIVYADIQKKIPKSAFKKIGIVIHAASETRSPEWGINYKTNVIGTKNILRACKDNKIKKLVYISSINTQLKNKGPYGKTKKIAENLVCKSGLNFIIIRPSMIYGAGDKNLSRTISLIKKFPIIPIIGAGDSMMQPVYVEDVADAVCKCLDTNIRKKIYNIVGPESFTFNEYLDIILQRLKKRKIKIHIPLLFAELLAAILKRIYKLPPITLEQVYSMTQNQKFGIEHEREELGYNPHSFEGELGGLI